jgi:N-methylhydantoinase B
MDSTVDTITLEVIRHRIAAITEQIEANIVRTAYSPLIYEYKDFAVGLIDNQGRLIAQGRGGIPLFCANLLGVAVADGLTLYGPGGFRNGDVVICNYSGVLGQHLNNVVMYTPVFAAVDAGVPEAFMAVVTHWADVGGRDVGSSASNNTVDIFQEGIQFRTVKLWNAGEPVADIYRMIEFNTRFPAIVLGDVASQLAGCLQGRDLYAQMLARYGAAQVTGAVHRIWAQSEADARAVVRSIPDGSYRAEASLDDDGIEIGKPVAIPVTVRVSGDAMEVDFSEVAGVLKGPFNSGAQGGGVTAARIAFNYLLNADEGPNDGTYRALSVALPAGKFLSAPATAPMARYSAPLATVIDVVLRAVGEALPSRVAGGHHGTFGVHVFHGRNRNGELFKNLETAQGGYGASGKADGAGPFKTFAHGDTFNVPVEMQEALYPLRILEFSLLADSGGAGTHRGGLGIAKAYRVLEPCRLNVGFDRTLCPPWGANGGLPGVAGGVLLKRFGEIPEHLLKADRPVAPGDIVEVRSGGGGGFGPPAARDRELVRTDLRLGYVTTAAARDTYGLPS